VARRALRRPRRREYDATPFAAFEHEGRAVPLLAGYRNAIKAGWRVYFWQTAVLVGAAGRAELTPGETELLERLRAARTLPAPLTDFEAAADALAARHPDVVRAREAPAGSPRLAVVSPPDLIDRKTAYYEATARQVGRRLRRRGVSLEGARVLEIGCATGYLTFALAGAGAAEAVGVDLDLDSQEAVAERDAVRERLVGAGAGSVRLETADAAALPLADGAMDVVVSMSAVEHLAELPSVLAETRRVLRPGGLALHVVDPWFSPQGGHSLCTLDFPWGHVRLDDDAFAAYLAEHRPHEREIALDLFRHGFARPRASAAGLRELVRQAGFAIVEDRTVTGGYDDHRALIDDGLVGSLAAHHPGLVARDLVTHAHRLLLRAL
jgi:SAM-dependent methyltransferase